MSTPQQRHLLSIDIGGTKVAWAVLAHEDRDWTVRERGSVPTQAQRGGGALAARVVSLATTVHASHPMVAGIAVASAGVVDSSTGVIASATDTIPGWAGTRLGPLLSAATGLPVAVLNDVHAHGLGESLLGAGRGHESTLVVAVGTGLGGAQVTAGAVTTGAHHMAGHVGHVHHHAARGMACSCGRDGHIEAIASGTGLAAWYRRRRGSDSGRTFGTGAPDVGSGADVAALAADGDPLAHAVITESAEALGEVLGSLANCLDPSVVLLTGSVTTLGEPWWSQVREGFRHTAMDGTASTPLHPGELGGDAPLLGAAEHFQRTLPIPTY